jgi:hypothetical protein
VRLIYFSGHGMSGATADSIVPAGTPSMDALQGAAQLVDTDLSAAVVQGAADLVVLIVDACRGVDGSTRPWGARAIDRTEDRFVSLLSSSPNADSFTLSSGASAFTQALVNVLAGEDSFSLVELQSQVEAECRQLTQREGLPEQTPSLRHGETTQRLQEFLSRPWIPPPVVIPPFDPARLHVVAVQAEGATSSILDFTQTLLSNLSRREILWNSFRASWTARQLLRGKRELGEYRPDSVALTKVDLESAFDGGRLRETIRRIVEADVALIDGTGFQPGAMFLLGIRAATRRGVTVVSLGDKREGEFFERPFLLVDIGYASHMDRADMVGPDPRFKIFLDRISEAFDWLGSDSSYADLPLHAALRVTRSRSDRIRPLGPDQGVLILCSYHDEHWTYLDKHLLPALEEAFSNIRTKPEGAFLRFLDLRDPRLVSLGVADQLRRAVACVVDWSGSTKSGAPSPSVFFEAGVRAAVHPRDAIHVYAPGRFPEGLRHLKALKSVLDPVPYDAVKDRVREYMARSPETDVDAPYRRIYNVVADAVGSVMEAPDGPITMLERTAQAIRYLDRERDLVAVQVLFADENKAVMKNYAQLGKQTLYAAWVYARHTGKHAEGARLKEILYQHLDLDNADDLTILAELSESEQGDAGEIDERRRIADEP